MLPAVPLPQTTGNKQQTTIEEPVACWLLLVACSSVAPGNQQQTTIN
jgi:hypothetical protein